jgi:hypothetical protein
MGTDQFRRRTACEVATDDPHLRSSAICAAVLDGLDGETEAGKCRGYIETAAD